MNRWIVDPLIVLGVALIILALWQAPSLFEQDPAPLLQEAYDSYRAGEQAANAPERQRAFNKALEVYSALEDRYKPTKGNGKLYYDMANTFYQLEAYPWAILNGYRAAALAPRDERMKAVLNAALKKLQLPPEEGGASLESALFFHSKLSLPERIQLFSALAALAFAAFSLYIWTEGRLWRIIGGAFAVLATVMVLSLAYTYYVAPIEGVLIRSTLLYRDAGTQYAPVSEDPAPSGQKLTVLDTAEMGKWLKVETPAGVVGYVPGENLRLVW